MMRTHFIAGAAIALGLGLTMMPPGSSAEETMQRTETTTYSGLVQGFEPAESVIVLESKETKRPSAYKYSQTTKFIGEDGIEISSEKVSEEIVHGREATIHIDPSSNLVSKVMVRPTVERRTTTTTTEIN
jgi:hypothetical protein